MAVPACLGSQREESGETDEMSFSMSAYVITVLGLIQVYVFNNDNNNDTNHHHNHKHNQRVAKIAQMISRDWRGRPHSS